MWPAGTLLTDTDGDFFKGSNMKLIIIKTLEHSVAQLKNK